MDSLIRWFNQNHTQIVWFLIGWLVQAALIKIHRGDYLGAFIDVALAYFNYALYTRRM